MKKRIKYRLKNDLAVPFWTAVILCMLGVAASSLLFYRSFFRALEKLNETPIATITFKYKTAQRKFLDRMVWDRLRQNSPVYNGDTLHTADLSEATVWFEDGTILELSSNTMAQVFRHGDGSLATALAEGALTVDSTGTENAVTLTSNGISVAVEHGAQLHAQTENADTGGTPSVQLNVLSGSATLNGAQSLAEGTALSVDNAGNTQPSLIVTEPHPQAKIIYHTQGVYPVRFAWNNDNETAITLTVATDKDFSNVVRTVNANGMSEMNVQLDKGTYYWKLQDMTQNADETSRRTTHTGKVQLMQSLAPELIAPVNSYRYQYRTREPAVRFIWLESEAASAYELTVADNPDMHNPLITQRTSSTSSIISTLDEGTYWWRVTPYYTVNRIGLANESATGIFTIEKRGELVIPTLNVPAPNALVDKTAGRGITFSWRMESEAVRYHLVVADNPELRTPSISVEVADNFYTLQNRNAIANGEYYWAVTQIDGEGNESPRSSVRSFFAVNGSVEQRTVFPPDNYTVWEPLLQDMRFTWKTNLPFAQHMQIARDEAFANIVYDVEDSNMSRSGIQLAPGTYWWRIYAQSGTIDRATDGKKLVVVPSLASPVLSEPTQTIRAVVRPQTPYSFHWKAVDGADYYRVRIYDERSNEIADENFVTDTFLEYDFETFPEATYRWNVQAFSYETATTSRRTGTIASTPFELRKIRPVDLLAPANNEVIDGITAMENPPSLQWSAVESVASSEITLIKIERMQRTVKAVQKNPQRTYNLEALGAGTYEWTVRAETYDGLDISAQTPRRFTVTPIPPFDAPRAARTNSTYFDATVLRKEPYVTFSWNAVQRASDYVLHVQDSKGRTVLTQTVHGTSFTLEDLTKLSKDTFTWSVKAVTLNQRGTEILRDGEQARATFTIDFTLSSGMRRRDTGNYYGQ
ncbi:MAG: hypothetical protein IJR50_02050 [Treponema sp.]|nr:hypothetical protein [Treponema sp.]